MREDFDGVGVWIWNLEIRGGWKGMESTGTTTI